MGVSMRAIAILWAALMFLGCAPAAEPLTRDYSPTITRDAFGVPSVHGRDARPLGPSQPERIRAPVHQPAIGHLWRVAESESCQAIGRTDVS